MKLITFYLMMTIFMIICEKKNYLSALKIDQDTNLRLQINNNLNSNVTQLYNNSNENFNFDSINIKNTIESTLSNLKHFTQSLEDKIRAYENKTKENELLKTELSPLHTKSVLNSFSKLRRRKNKQENEDALMFYNSLSLIMLAMLAGGLVGVIFILYFSFKQDQ